MIITGSNFSGSVVTIGGASATLVTVVSSTEITCVTPPGTPGPATVTVINNDATVASAANAFTYQNTSLAPTITSLVPNNGSVGTVVSINGTNFSADAQVLIGTYPAGDVTWVNAQLITCTIPNETLGVKTVAVINGDSLSSIDVNGFTINNGPGEAHKKCGGHGISALLLAPLMLWGLLALSRTGRRQRPSISE